MRSSTTSSSPCTSRSTSRALRCLYETSGAWPICRVHLTTRTSVIVYQVRYVPHFTPLDGACMLKRAATFDMQRISAAMTGGTCRKRRPNLTCTRFSESGQRTQVYRLIPSISPCCRRHRKERSAGRFPPYHPLRRIRQCKLNRGVPWVLGGIPATSVNHMKSSSESHQVQW